LTRATSRDTATSSPSFTRKAWEPGAGPSRGQGDARVPALVGNGQDVQRVGIFDEHGAVQVEAARHVVHQAGEVAGERRGARGRADGRGPANRAERAAAEGVAEPRRLHDRGERER